MEHLDHSPETLLKNAGLKVTRQRSAVLGALMDASGSMSADEIYFQLKQQGESFGLSTVYRALASLVEHSLVSRADIPGSTSQCFLLKSAGHRHRLVCTRCRTSILLDGCPVEAFAAEVGSRYGFVITGHSFEIFGLCPDCRKMEDTSDV